MYEKETGKNRTISLPNLEIRSTSSAQEKTTKTKQEKDLTLPVVSPESRADLNSMLCKEHTVGGISHFGHA